MSSRAERRRAEALARSRTQRSQAKGPLSAIRSALTAGDKAKAQAAFDAFLEQGSLPATVAREAAQLAEPVGRRDGFLALLQHAAARAEGEALVEYAAAAGILGERALAGDLLARTAEAAPPDAGLWTGIARAQAEWGLTDAALKSLDYAIAIDPRHAPAHLARADLLMKAERYEAAQEAASIAVTLAPDEPDHRVLLSTIFRHRLLLEEAFLMAQSVLETGPNARAYAALGETMRAAGKLDRALEHLRKAVDLDPWQGSITPYLFALLMSDVMSDEEVFAEHLRLAAKYDKPEGLNRRHRNDPDPGRRLKVGFVSGDLREHPVAKFLLPVLRHLDRTQFETYGISAHPNEDRITDLLRAHLDHWRSIAFTSDAEVAAWIERRGIDILIDLSGHTDYNRLPLFGLKPAPVQVTWIGYPGTTGMRTIDYRITDAYCDPPGVAEKLSSEALLRLPGMAAAFEALIGGDPDVADPPCTTGQPFTFGCMNQVAKISRTAAQTWAEILHAAPGSRLLLCNVNHALTAQHLIDLFGGFGVDRERLLFAKRTHQRAFMELHGKIDLSLDPFPYNGGTSTYLALRMGVPVLALDGGRTVARLGAGIMRSIGLPEFAATSREEYVARAVALATDPAPLVALRHTLRDRLTLASEEGHAQNARHFGDALRQAWTAWCAKARGEPPVR